MLDKIPHISCDIANLSNKEESAWRILSDRLTNNMMDVIPEPSTYPTKTVASETLQRYVRKTQLAQQSAVI
jgi:hypothetical protein